MNKLEVRVVVEYDASYEPVDLEVVQRVAEMAIHHAIRVGGGEVIDVEAE